MRDRFRSLARYSAALAVLSACQSTPSSDFAAPARAGAQPAPRAISEAGMIIYRPMLLALREALLTERAEHLPELFSALRAVADQRGDRIERVLLLGLDTEERRRLQDALADAGQRGGVGRLAAPAPRRAPPYRGASTTKAWLDRELRALLSEFGEREPDALPDSFLRRVGHYIHRYTRGDLREWFERALAGHDKYRTTLRQALAPYALPDSVLYMAFVESAFNPHARSKAGALGIWQFIPSTAERYGLVVEPWLDQRQDPVRSTKAAAEYLQDLMLEFGAGRSALLAIAAYNAGEGRVRRELRKLDHVAKRNFWTLAEQGLLAEETREYLPKILAAAIVGKYRVDFRFGASAFSEPVDTVTLHRPVPLARVLELTGMDIAALARFNPELSAGDLSTPDRRVAFLLAAPARRMKALRSAPDIVAAARDPMGGRERMIAYTVQPRNRWQAISEWSGVPVERLQSVNAELHGDGLKAGEPLYLLDPKPGLRPLRHTVRRGESLSLIAGRYRVPLGWLRDWNGICGDHLDLGARLQVYALAPQGAGEPSAPVPQPTFFAYTVRAGDSISQIARAFHVRVDALKCANGLASDRIHPGQRLSVPLPHRVAKRVVRVVRGDTLSLIASRYGVSVQSIKVVNGLRQDTIRVGDVLTLYLRS